MNKKIVQLTIVVIFSFIYQGCKHDLNKKMVSDVIGVKDFIITDTNRIDPNYGGFRLLNLRIWYPSEKNTINKNSKKSSYYYGIESIKAHSTYWSNEDINFVESIKANSFYNLQIAKSKTKFPLLIFSPSLGGNLSRYTYYAEQFAKNGFVVLAVNHLHESEFVFDKKSKLYETNQQFHDSLINLKIPEEISADRYRRVKGKRQKVLGEDLLFCLNEIENLNKTDFNSKIDLNKIGVYGHSIGGAAAIYASYLDNRIKAVVDIDGTPPSVALENGIDVPYMFIEDLTDYKNHVGYIKLHKRRNDFCKKNSANSYRVLFANTNHNSFLDLNYHLETDTIKKRKLLKVLDGSFLFMNNFFKSYLNEKDHNLNAYKSDSVEVFKFKK